MLKKLTEPNYVLVIHGGTIGTMSGEGEVPEKRTTYKAALSRALKAGYDVLKNGGEAMDAVVAAVSVMEGGGHALMQISGQSMANDKMYFHRLSFV